MTSSSSKEKTETASIVDPWKARAKVKPPPPEPTAEDFAILVGAGGGIRVYGVRGASAAVKKVAKYLSEVLPKLPDKVRAAQSVKVSEKEVDGDTFSTVEALWVVLPYGTTKDDMTHYTVGALAQCLRALKLLGHSHREIVPYRG